MNALIDAFWRAVAYCAHPRVILLSVLPLLLMAGLGFGLGWLWWTAAIDAVRAALESWDFVAAALDWLDAAGLAGMRMALAPLVVVFLATPVIVIVCMLVVAAVMTPAIVSLVAARRFPVLERKRGGSLVAGALAAAVATLLALLAMVVTLPLWLVPPLALIVPPLIWGWLTSRVLGYDVLAEHASVEERRVLVRGHRGPLLAIGVVSGYLGAAPSLLWASGALSVVLAPVLVPAAIWVYTLVFAFASLWFAHYLLAALHAMRLPAAPAPGVAAAIAVPIQPPVRAALPPAR